MKDDTLYVKTFGGFSLSWNGKLLSGKSRSSESQFNYLMQALLHSGAAGVSRDRLEEILFGEREIGDVHHAAQSVVYNAKKQLRKWGLPDVNYIELRQKVFYWTDRIPVVEDASQLERLAQAADETGDMEERLELLLKAAGLYEGEFLPNQTGMLWVAAEARRYHALFCRCVENAALLLRMNRDFARMEQLGRHTARVDPLADWEAVTMEALISDGRNDEARQFYDDTVERYLREQGLRPSGRFMELQERLSGQMRHQYAMLDEIQTKLTENEPGGGGYLCSYPVFRGIYQMVERLMERGGQAVFLMLCTVVDSKGNPMREGVILKELSARLEKAICQSVRHSDTVNRYGEGQYLVLLVNTTREDCEIIQKRINRNFLVGRQRTGIQYYVNSVLCSPGR